MLALAPRAGSPASRPDDEAPEVVVIVGTHAEARAEAQVEAEAAKEAVQEAAGEAVDEAENVQSLERRFANTLLCGVTKVGVKVVALVQGVRPCSACR